MQDEPIPTEQAPEPPRPRCLNCDKKLPKSAVFCPRCAQRNNQGKASMRELFQRFWANFSHLDAKFVKMCWQLFVPGKVTQEYFMGRQKRYPHPVQFFFIVMFFFLLAFNSTCKNKNFKFQGQDVGFNWSIDSTGTAVEDDYFNSHNSSTWDGLVQRYAFGLEVRDVLKTLPPDLNTPTTRRAVDSILQVVGPARKVFGESVNDSTFRGDSLDLGLATYTARVAVVDMVNLEPEAVAEKYGIRDWKERLLFVQAIKSAKKPQELVNKYVGSIAWTILALVTVMSCFLALLYVRQRRYFVEHFVFLLHQHSGVFLLLTLALLINKFYRLNFWWILVFALLGLHLFLAMRRYYGQGFWKTTLKWTLYSFINLFVFTFLFVIGLLVAVMLF